MTKQPTVFAGSDLRRGDVIAYPAVLRREHGGVRSLLVVERVDGDHVRCLGKDGWECSVFPSQLRENGVLLIKRPASSAVSRPAGDAA